MCGQRVGRGSQGRDRQLEDREAGLTTPDAHHHLSNVENSFDDCPLVIFNMPRFYQMCTYREICDPMIQQKPKPVIHLETGDKNAAIYLYDYLLCIYKDCLLQWVFWGLIFFTLILYDIWNKGSSWSEEHLIISLKGNRKVKGVSSFISSIWCRHFLLYCVSVQLIEARDGSCSFTRLSVVKPKQKCRSL